MPYADKADKSANGKRWYAANRDKCLKGHRRWREENKDIRRTYRKPQRARKVARVKAFIRDLRNGPCTDCGLVDHRVMEFDHCRGTKADDVTRMVNSCTVSQVMRELAKCDLVCANCHRIREWNRTHEEN